MSERKYQRPRMKDGRLQIYYGRLNGDAPDWCVVHGNGTCRSDARFALHVFAGANGHSGAGAGASFVQELEARGYDITTLRFTIDKKQSTLPADACKAVTP
jgi:hypothetical protein